MFDLAAFAFSALVRLEDLLLILSGPAPNRRRRSKPVPLPEASLPAFAALLLRLRRLRRDAVLLEVGALEVAALAAEVLEFGLLKLDDLATGSLEEEPATDSFGVALVGVVAGGNVVL